MVNKKSVIAMVMVFSLIVLPMVSAGVGIKTSRESLLVAEGKEVCITDYSVYNPWPDESYVTVEVSGGLEDVLQMKDMVPIFVPAETYNEDAIPVEFCFKIPRVYERDCLIGSMLCVQTCSEEQVSYEGEILIKSVPGPADTSGSGGSATMMSVSAPLNLKVKCEAHGRKYTPVYILLAIIALAVIIYLVWKKKRKPADVRKNEELVKLKGKMAKLEAKE